MYTIFDENGEVNAKQLNSKSPEIHTVPTREQHELRVQLFEDLDKELAKEKETGLRLYS